MGNKQFVIGKGGKQQSKNNIKQDDTDRSNLKSQIATQDQVQIQIKDSKDIQQNNKKKNKQDNNIESPRIKNTEDSEHNQTNTQGDQIQNQEEQSSDDYEDEEEDQDDDEDDDEEEDEEDENENEEKLQEDDKNKQQEQQNDKQTKELETSNKNNTENTNKKQGQINKIFKKKNKGKQNLIEDESDSDIDYIRERRLQINYEEYIPQEGEQINKKNKKIMKMKKYNTSFLDQNFQLKTLLSKNTQQLFQQRTFRPEPYPYYYHSQFLGREFTKLSNFVLELNNELIEKKVDKENKIQRQVWQTYRQRDPKCKFIMKIYLGSHDIIKQKHKKKLQLMKQLEKISPEYIVKSEELYLSTHEIFTEDSKDVLIEVKSGTQINLEDIIKIRHHQQKPFSEAEIFFFLQHLTKILYFCEQHNVYHSHLKLENIVVFQQGQKSSDNKIDPLDNIKHIIGGDDIDFKIKDFLYHKYNFKTQVLTISKKKATATNEMYYYPQEKIKDFQDDDGECNIENIYKLDVYSLGIIIKALMELKLPSRILTYEQIKLELDDLDLNYPQLQRGLRKLLSDDEQDRPTYKQIIEKLELVQIIKPKTKKNYDLAQNQKENQRKRQIKEEQKKKKKEGGNKKKQQGKNVIKDNFQQGEIDEKEEEQLNKISMEILKAKTYILIKNFEQSEKQLSDFLNNIEDQQFMQNYFHLEDYIDQSFLQAFNCIKQNKFKEAKVMLKSQQNQIQKANLKKTLLSLKVQFYLTFTIFMLQEKENTISELNELQSQMHFLNIKLNLKNKVKYDFNILRGKIYSDLAFQQEAKKPKNFIIDIREHAISSFSDNLKQNLSLTKQQESETYYFLGIEYFYLALYEISKEYFQKSLKNVGKSLVKLEDNEGENSNDEQQKNPSDDESSPSSSSANSKSSSLSVEQQVSQENFEGDLPQNQKQSREDSDYDDEEEYDEFDQNYLQDINKNNNMGIANAPNLSISKKTKLNLNLLKTQQTNMNKYQDNEEKTQDIQEKQESIDLPYEIMMYGYTIQIFFFTCRESQLSANLEKVLSIIRHYLYDDKNIDTVVNWCNIFAPYIAINNNFQTLGEHINIAILKNKNKMSFPNEYLYNVMGQIYYYSGKYVQAERYFLKSCQVEPADTIYHCISKEWMAYLKFYNFEKQQKKGLEIFIEAESQYQTFMRNNPLYKKFIQERLIYIKAHLAYNFRDKIRIKEADKIMQELIDREDYNKADVCWEAQFKFFQGFLNLQLGNQDIGFEVVVEAIQQILDLFPEAPMLGVRWYMLAIADCMCLEYTSLAIDFCQICKELISKISTEEDYSDFYILYGYINLINNQYSKAEEILEQAEIELEEERQVNQNDNRILSRIAYVGDILGRIFIFTGHFYKALSKLEKTAQHMAGLPQNPDIVAQLEEDAFRFGSIARCQQQLGMWKQSISNIRMTKQLFINTKLNKAKEKLLCIMKEFEIKMETLTFQDIDKYFRSYESKAKQQIDIIGLTDYPEIQAGQAKILAKYYMKVQKYEEALKTYIKMDYHIDQATDENDISRYEVKIIKCDLLFHQMLETKGSQQYKQQIFETLTQIKAAYKYFGFQNLALEADLYRNMGRFMLYDSNFKEAIGYLKKAINLYNIISDNNNHPLMGPTYLYLGECYFALKENVQSVENKYLKSLEIFTQFYNAQHPEVPLLLLELGKIFFLKSPMYLLIQNIYDATRKIFKIQQKQFLITQILENNQKLIQILINNSNNIMQRDKLMLQFFKENMHHESTQLLSHNNFQKEKNNSIQSLKNISQSQEESDENNVSFSSGQFQLDKSYTFDYSIEKFFDTEEDFDLTSITLPYLVKDPCLLYFQQGIQISEMFFDHNYSTFKELRQMCQYIKKIFIVDEDQYDNDDNESYNSNDISDFKNNFKDGFSPFSKPSLGGSNSPSRTGSFLENQGGQIQRRKLLQLQQIKQQTIKETFRDQQNSEKESSNSSQINNDNQIEQQNNNEFNQQQ